MVRDDAKMEPKKALFIVAITKDITLESTICDLIENSINAAKKLCKFKTLRGYRVELYIGKNYNDKYDFVIKDNCGGITREDAKNRAFMLGNDFEDNKLGFGIGMKRALFKLADDFILESYTIDDKFKIQMDVKEWQKKSSWNTPIRKNTNKEILEPGVVISISRLNSKIESELLSTKFQRDLINTIKINFEFALEAGFEIYLNRKKVEYSSSLFAKNLLEDRVYDISENEIKLKIEHNSKRSYEYYGWNYVINGRNIIHGDKYILNNWQKSIKENKYNFEKFVGFVFINGDDVSGLPLNTSKDGIDINNSVYKKIQKYMISAMEKTKEYFEDNERSIQYKKPISEIDELKVALKQKYNSDIGKISFGMCLDEIRKNNKKYQK